MTDREIDNLIWEIDRMARTVGCRFVPDRDKIAAFREAQRREEAVREQYRKAVRECRP